MSGPFNDDSALILGGARSGKSVHGEQLVLSANLDPVYIATSQIGDQQMRERIDLHKARRGPNWSLIEEPLWLVDAIRSVDKSNHIILVDCLTLWLSNLMHNERDLADDVAGLTAIIPALSAKIVFVSSEVGLGIVPENALARRFRDEQGQLNQLVAAAVERVDFIAAGLPLTLKPQRI